MLHTLRRIFVLVLCLALVCCLSVTAFAATSFNDDEDFDDGNTTVEFAAHINRYTTDGFSAVDSSIAPANARVAMTGRYIDSEYNLRDDLSDEDIETNIAFVNVSFSDDEIFSMVDAAYQFWAEVPTTYDWQEYVDSALVEY